MNAGCVARFTLAAQIPALSDFLSDVVCLLRKVRGQVILIWAELNNDIVTPAFDAARVGGMPIPGMRHNYGARLWTIGKQVIVDGINAAMIPATWVCRVSGRFKNRAAGRNALRIYRHFEHLIP